MVNDSADLRRENKTRDIVKRIGVITADRIRFTNYPLQVS